MTTPGVSRSIWLALRGIRGHSLRRDRLDSGPVLCELPREYEAWRARQNSSHVVDMLAGQQKRPAGRTALPAMEWVGDLARTTEMLDTALVILPFAPRAAPVPQRGADSRTFVPSGATNYPVIKVLSCRPPCFARRRSSVRLRSPPLRLMSSVRPPDRRSVLGATDARSGQLPSKSAQHSEITSHRRPLVEAETEPRSRSQRCQIWTSTPPCGRR